MKRNWVDTMKGDCKRERQGTAVSAPPPFERPVFEPMEPRILLSADLPGVDALLPPAHHDQTLPDPVDLQVVDPVTHDAGDVGSLADAPTDPAPRQLLIIDGAVDDLQTLVQDFRTANDGQIGAVFILDPSRDGIAQVGEILSGQQDLTAVHIVSHGSDGALTLGSSRLDADSLDGYANALGDWGNAFTADGDLLLYGCDLAASADGRQLVDAIADLTGADVAASDDVTGAAAAGGDWQLEYQAGVVEARSDELADIARWDGALGSITVTYFNDQVSGDADLSSLAALNANPGSDGKVSLREAIIAANADAGQDTINLVAGTYQIEIAATGENAAADGDFDITDDLVIQGAGNNTTTIDGRDIGRVFAVHGATLTLNDLKIFNGNAGPENDGGNGGGLLVDDEGQAYLNRVVIDGSTGAAGGGAYLEKGYLQIQETTLSNNTASAEGGALYAKDWVDLYSSTLLQNGAPKGGAIFVHNLGYIVLSNDTLSGNSSDEGGGVYNKGLVWLNHVTVADNTASAKGGGLFNNTGAASAWVLNSLVGNNSAPNGPDAYGDYTSDGDNLVENVAGSTGFSSDITGIDPKLQSLGPNGGPTLTYALLPSSPAVDAVSYSLTTTDQRGFARPSGAADIGAYEYGASVATQAPAAVNDSYAIAEDNILSVALADRLVANDTDPNLDPLNAYVTDAPLNGQLTIAPLATVVETNITANAATDQHPVYSPDGSRIAFSSDRSGSFELYLMNADGSNLVALTNLGASSWSPSWSPDGSRLAFASNTDGNNEIYLINADGTGLTRLTNNAADEGQPVWSPDGTQIAFRSNRDGNEEIYVVNIDGTGLLNLTNNPAADRRPQFSPDGSRILFTTDRDGDFNLYTMGADGSALYQVTTDPAADRWASYSPDGSRILFSSVRDGDRELYVINVDGTGLTQLTQNLDQDVQADWSPGGTEVVFQSDRDGNSEIYTAPLLFDGTFTYSPNVNFNGADSFSYVAFDGALSSNVAVASINITPVNDAPTGGVTIDDPTPAEGQTLTAANTLADADGLGAITYTWKADGTSVGTGSSYTTTQADVGKTIAVEASYTDADGTGEMVASAATAPVSNVDQPAIISGDTSYSGNEGDTPSGVLSASDADGLTDGSYFSVTTQGANGTASIDPATGAWSFMPTDSNWHGSDSFTVTVTDDLGGTTTQAVAITLAPVNDAPTGGVTIDDPTPTEGQTLTASNTLADADGLGPIAYTWKADGTTVGTGSSYTTTAGDVGKTIAVEASYTDGDGTVETVASAATAGVVSAPNPAPTAPPVVEPSPGSEAQAPEEEVENPASPEEVVGVSEVISPAAARVSAPSFEQASTSFQSGDGEPDHAIPVEVDEEEAEPLERTTVMSIAGFARLSVPGWGGQWDHLAQTPLANEIRTLIESDLFGSELDRVRSEINAPAAAYQVALGTATAATTALSVGYVAWLLRGGVLLSTMLSSLPAWQFIDPLPVLARTGGSDEEDGESLEGIIEKGASQERKDTEASISVQDGS